MEIFCCSLPFFLLTTTICLKGFVNKAQMWAFRCGANSWSWLVSSGELAERFGNEEKPWKSVSLGIVWMVILTTRLNKFLWRRRVMQVAAFVQLFFSTIWSEFAILFCYCVQNLVVLLWNHRPVVVQYAIENENVRKETESLHKLELRGLPRRKGTFDEESLSSFEHILWTKRSLLLPDWFEMGHNGRTGEKWSGDQVWIVHILCSLSRFPQTAFVVPDCGGVSSAAEKLKRS